MNESSKCYEMRLKRGDFDRWLKGRGIDIGCGGDPLKLPPHINGEVIGWDIPQGDATLMSGLISSSFDFVYSSHCLEHLQHIDAALARWTDVLKPGCALYLVVPDVELYDSKFGLFNPDHKHSFSLTVTRAQLGRNNHWHLAQDLQPLMIKLGLHIEHAALEDDHYDYSLQNFNIDQTLGNALAQICIVARRTTVRQSRLRHATR